MSSNTPPPITPNTNTDADFSHDDNNPPTANVVTQASQLAHEFDLVSTPAAQTTRHNLNDEFMDYQDHECILEHANTDTTPIMEPSTVPYYPTPTNASPDTSKKRIHSMMESEKMNRFRLLKWAKRTLMQQIITRSKYEQDRLGIRQFEFEGRL